MIEDYSLVSGGDCFSHWHSEDRVPTADFLHGLEGVTKRVLVSANYQVLPGDDFIEVSNGSTVTLPEAKNGQVYTVTRTGTSNVTVACFGTGTVCGVTSVILTVRWMSLTFKAVPNGWIII